MDGTPSSGSGFGLGYGCGVTAYDEADAMKLKEAHLFPIYGTRTILEIVQDIDVRTLNEKKIRPNMGNPAVRGIWFACI